MNVGKENVVAKKSYLFEVEIVNVVRFLASEKNEFVLSKQLLRSGTSIGANVHEAISSESKKDFIHKLGIAVKESRETSYWLSLLKDTDYISVDKFDIMIGKCNELTKILNSIIITIKERYFNSK